MKVQLIVEASTVESPDISEEAINTIAESIRKNLNKFKEKYKTTRDVQLFSECMTIVNVQIFKGEEDRY
jgi:ribosome-associated translation inhibitor RaiA